MPQDAFTLRYLCEELNVVFKGGKINRIVQPDNDEVVFTIYNGKCTQKLSLCVNPASPRIGIVDQEQDCPLTAPNFCMLLRKHLLSATINSISLVGFDRIVKIDLTPTSEFFDNNDKVLFVELMGRYSNIILTENGKILGGNRGINVFDNGVRPLFVGYDYLLPPVGDKKHPQDKCLIDIFDEVDVDSLAECICANVQGIASSTSIEFVKGIHSKLEVENKGNFIFENLNKFLFSSTSNPCVITKNGVVTDVCVYPYSQINGEKIFFDYLWKAEQYYYKSKIEYKNFSTKKDRAKNIISNLIKKARKKLGTISSREKDALNCEQNKLFGELILSNIYKIKDGMDRIEVLNYYDNSNVVISLDKNLSPSKNAENYYKKYNKQKRTLLAIAPQKKLITEEISYLESVLSEIELCDNIEDVLHVYNELSSMGFVKEQNNKSKQKPPVDKYREYLYDGIKIKVGRNNTENDKLTFSAKPNDIWLHAKDYHSSHVIIEVTDKPILDNVIVFAGEVCAYYSKGRESGKVEIVYTPKSNVKKPSKSKPGFCVYEKYQSIMVNPKKNAEFIKNN